MEYDWKRDDKYEGDRNFQTKSYLRCAKAQKWPCSLPLITILLLYQITSSSHNFILFDTFLLSLYISFPHDIQLLLTICHETCHVRSLPLLISMTLFFLPFRYSFPFSHNTIFFQDTQHWYRHEAANWTPWQSPLWQPLLSWIRVARKPGFERRTW